MCKKGELCERGALISRAGVGRSHDGDEIVLLLVLREVRVGVQVRKGGILVLLLLGLRVALERNAVTESEDGDAKMNVNCCSLTLGGETPTHRKMCSTSLASLACSGVR